MSQLTYLIAQVCFMAGKGNDWITHFREDAAFDDLRIPHDAKNNPSTLADIIHQLDEEQRDQLEADVEELIQSDIYS